MVSEMDAAIGKLMDELDAQGIRDDTLIFFMSDNGGLTEIVCYRILPIVSLLVWRACSAFLFRPVSGIHTHQYV